MEKQIFEIFWKFQYGFLREYREEINRDKIFSKIEKLSDRFSTNFELKGLTIYDRTREIKRNKTIGDIPLYLEERRKEFKKDLDRVNNCVDKKAI